MSAVSVTPGCWPFPRLFCLIVHDPSNKSNCEFELLKCRSDLLSNVPQRWNVFITHWFHYFSHKCLEVFVEQGLGISDVIRFDMLADIKHKQVISKIIIFISYYIGSFVFIKGTVVSQSTLLHHIVSTANQNWLENGRQLKFSIILWIMEWEEITII